MNYDFFKDLAIIIIAAKCFGLLARKLKAPQVVGEIVAGLIIGPNILGVVDSSNFLVQMAEIGVIMLMFMAGMETDFKDLLKTGPKALLIACAGVLLPLIGGFILYSCFFGFSAVGTDDFYKAVFIGVIITATSVSITVSALRELGKLKGIVGTTILSAAIIDDVIGIMVLTFVIGFKNPDVQPTQVLLSTVLFFVFSIVVGFVTYLLFKLLDKRYPKRQRLPIYGLALCFVLSYLAEKYFGIADITGAYVAGLILCNIKSSDYIVRKLDINSYMLFGPIFFASIGLKTEIKGITPAILMFTAAFVLVALVTKVVGCGLVARLCGFKGKNSLRIGVGMMTRGEVALIVSQKGLAVGLMDSVYFAAVIILIIISSVVTPILLKILYRNEQDEEENRDVSPKVAN